MKPRFVASVDVGTHSARAGIFAADGMLLGRAAAELSLHRPAAHVVEQSSTDIWRAVSEAVQEAVRASGVGPDEIGGISFDATCSLVVLAEGGAPLQVSPSGSPEWDVISWMDHRAIAEADECTASRHEVLRYVGGVMSPEMQIPKIMWLKRHLGTAWSRVRYLFDLTDFLAWRASGSLDRSACTLACKWTYLEHEGGWQRDFLDSMDVADMRERGQLPERASAIGRFVGPLTVQAAAGLGLSRNCRVGVGLIDAHAGALGLLGGQAGDNRKLDAHAAMIAGTSTCLMGLASEPRFIGGVWGPYMDAVLPGMWLNEGGQSATGSLLDHILRVHSAGGDPDAALHQAVARRIHALREAEGIDFAARLHVLPDFHGNRSPLADPDALGVVSGLTLDASFDGLCRLYWRTAIAIANGVRQIVEAFNTAGYEISTLHVAGGHVNSEMLLELYSDVANCDVAVAPDTDAVLLGTAMAAAAAAGCYATLQEAATHMASGDIVRKPNNATREIYDRDFAKFLVMQKHRRELDG